MKRCECIFLILLIVLTFTLPMVLGATSDSIYVTFDPTGTIDIDLAPAGADIGSVTADSSKGTATDEFTLYNNGSVGADTQIEANATTDSGELTLDPDGSPETNYFSLEVTGTAPNQYITADPVNWQQDLAPGDSVTFGIKVYLGQISADYGQQKVTINVTGSIST